MDSWEDQYRRHPFWISIHNIQDKIERCSVIALSDPMANQAIRRISSVIESLYFRIKDINFNFVVLSDFDEITRHMEDISTQLSSYLDSKESSYLVNANNNVSSIIHISSRLWVSISEDAIVSANAAAEKYHQTTLKWISKITEDAKKIDESREKNELRLLELADLIANERQNLQSIVSGFQSQFSENQQTRGNSWSELVNSIGSQMSDWNARYSERLVAKASEFDEVVRDSKSNFEKSLQDLSLWYTDNAKEIVRKIENEQKAVEDLVGVIGALGVTSGYQKTAREAKYTVRVWNFITILSMSGLAWIAYSAFLPSTDVPLTWEGFSGKVFVALTVGVIAAYSAQQAAKYHATEVYSRKMALELAAIGPFLSPLPKEEKEKFLLKMGELSFGQPTEGSRKSHQEITSVISLIVSKMDKEQIKEFIEYVKSFLKK
jgi:hypothetical protein